MPREDALLVVALLVLAAWELPRRAAEPSGDLPWVSLVTVACVLPLLWRQTRPLTTVVVVGVAFGVYPLRDETAPDVLVQAVALLVAVYSAGAHCPPRPAVVALLVGGIAGWLRSLGLVEYDAVSAAVNSAWALPPWGAGVAVRRREQRARAAEAAVEHADRRAREVEAQAVVAERRRIARELHDVVAHSVTVMVLQARGGRRCVDADPVAAREAFDAVEELGSQALQELRRLLALLPDADAELADPRPGLDQATQLVDAVRRAGLDVELRIEGTVRPLPPAADVSGYRVLQEALTNALRYGAPEGVVARLCHRDEEVEIVVVNRVGSSQSGGAGQGLAGARERVAVFGGTLTAGREGDLFVLSALLPRQRLR